MGRSNWTNDGGTQRSHPSFDGVANLSAGTSVITTAGPGGSYGVTVSAVTSVSVEPPLLLVCIAASNPVVAAICANSNFCVNLLGPGQESVAAHFAGGANHLSGFASGGALWYGPPGEGARLVGAVASLVCRLQAAHASATHIVFIGRVTEFEAEPHVPPHNTDLRYGRSGDC